MQSLLIPAWIIILVSSLVTFHLDCPICGTFAPIFLIHLPPESSMYLPIKSPPRLYWQSHIFLKASQGMAWPYPHWRIFSAICSLVFGRVTKGNSGRRRALPDLSPNSDLFLSTLHLQQRMKPKALGKLGKCSTSQRHPHQFWKQGIVELPRLALNSLYSPG